MKVILHFGFPKTGSSTLQFGILKELNEEGSINLKTWRLNDDDEHLDVRPSSRLFNNEEVTDAYLDFKDNTINVLSDESLTAPIRLRKQNYGEKIVDPFTFPKILKEQIEKKYPNIDIDYQCVITLRNQAKLIFSQYVEEYNWKTYKNIDLLFNKSGEIDLSGYEIYNFEKYVSVLFKVFGKSNVVVSFFEDWRYDVDVFCNDIAKSFSTSNEKVMSSISTNHFNSKKKSVEGVYTKDGKRLVPYLNAEQEDQIMSHYYESNKKLARLIGCENKLMKYGYFK